MRKVEKLSGLFLFPSSFDNQRKFEHEIHTEFNISIFN